MALLAALSDQLWVLIPYSLLLEAAVSDPALRQMVRPIVRHVAALTECAQVL